jgi:site-specific DNA recombinase
MSWVRDALMQSHADERREHDAAIERLQAEYDRLQNRVHVANVDKLDGRIDAAFFDRMSAEWRRDRERCLRDIERHQDADQSYLEEGVRLLELVRNAQRLFAKQEAKEKCCLLNLLLSNCSWQAGELMTASRNNPSVFSRKPSPLPRRKKPPNRCSAAIQEAPAAQRSERSGKEWLPGQDSNLRQGG